MAQQTTAFTSDMVLARLRAEAEGDAIDGWRDVYLDNAKPAGMTAHAFAGYLSALQGRGDYRPIDNFAWGSVRIES